MFLLFILFNYSLLVDYIYLLASPPSLSYTELFSSFGQFLYFMQSSLLISSPLICVIKPTFKPFIFL